MGKQKQPEDVLGYRKRCLNYIKCPVCYGCRNYRTTDPDCETCKKSPKINICNTEIHKPGPISQLVPRPRIKLENGTTFKSNKGE